MLQLLGVIAHQVGRSDVGEQLIRSAIAIDPLDAEFHNNLGETLRAPRSSPAARKSLTRVFGCDDGAAGWMDAGCSPGSDRWLGMSAEQRDKARERFSHWQSLPPEERHALRSRWQKFQELPPNEQARVRENFHKFQQLPPARRQMLREQWHKASPAERQQMIEHARERREKGQMPRPPQAPRPHR